MSSHSNNESKLCICVMVAVKQILFEWLIFSFLDHVHFEPIGFDHAVYKSDLT